MSAAVSPINFKTLDAHKGGARGRRGLPGEKTADMPYSFDKVWGAACLVLQRARWSIVRADRALGHLEVKVPPVALVKWKEPFYVDLTRVDGGLTRVSVTTMPTYQLFDWGITGQYIDSFLSSLEKTLESSR